jgi:hypothetical protein
MDNNQSPEEEVGHSPWKMVALLAAEKNKLESDRNQLHRAWSDAVDDIAAAIARAEAAEADAQEWRDSYATLESDALAVRDDALLRMAEMGRDNAALRAQLDEAQGWRPVTEKPANSEMVDIRARGWYDKKNQCWHVLLGNREVATPRWADWRPAPKDDE